MADNVLIYIKNLWQITRFPIKEKLYKLFLCIFASQLQKVMVIAEILKKIDALGGIIIEAGIKYTSKLVLLSIVLATVGCDHQNDIDVKMDIAESLMNSKPDSALAVLEGIPTSDVKGKAASARYALLKSMALDKNYIDTTQHLMFFNLLLIIISSMVLQMSSYGHIIIKAGFTRTRVMMIRRCNHS